MDKQVDRAAEFIHSFLAHDAPTIYDPVKAHEYYLKNRELKGRNSGADLKTDTQKQGWDYSKNKLGEMQQEEFDAASEEKRVAIEQIRETAQAIRTEIREKLVEVLSQISEGKQSIVEQINVDRAEKLEELSNVVKGELERIARETQQKIDALPPVPKGLGIEATRKLTEERSEELAKIRGDASIARNETKEVANQIKGSIRQQASEEKAAVSIESKNLKTAQRESSSSEREQLGADVKASIESARSNYETLKNDLRISYESKLQTEYEAIKENVK